MNNTKKIGIIKEFDMIPHAYRNIARDELKRRLHKSMSTVNNKISGRTPIFEIEKPIFRAVLRKYGIEINN